MEASFLLSGGQRRGQGVLPAPAVFQVTLIQDNQYAKAVRFGGACFEPHQLPKGSVLLNVYFHVSFVVINLIFVTWHIVC